MSLVKLVSSTSVPLDALMPAENLLSLKIPLADVKIPAGFPSPAEPYATGYVDFNEYLIRNPATTISVYCGSDSMRDAGIDKDDLLIIDRSVKPVHRDIVMADLGNEYTIKRLCIKADGTVELHSENKQGDFPNIVFKDGDQLDIVGVLMYIIKSPKR